MRILLLLLLLVIVVVVIVVVTKQKVKSTPSPWPKTWSSTKMVVQQDLLLSLKSLKSHSIIKHFTFGFRNQPI